MHEFRQILLARTYSQVRLTLSSLAQRDPRRRQLVAPDRPLLTVRAAVLQLPRCPRWQ